MNSSQVNLLKETYMTPSQRADGKPGTMGEYMRFLLDGGIDFTTSKDCVIFDDDNELLHCICINEDMRSQSDYPIKVISSEYAMVQQIEVIMTQENFERFLDEGYISTMISDDKKEFILNWSKRIENQATQPMDPEPAYEDNIIIRPMPATKIEKETLKTSNSKNS